jgi:hypothetical protein
MNGLQSTATVTLADDVNRAFRLADHPGSGRSQEKVANPRFVRCNHDTVDVMLARVVENACPCMAPRQMGCGTG